MNLKEELFEEIGKLYILTTRMEYKKKVYERSVDKCDKQALKIQQLENKFIKRYKRYPSF